ncbi:MAG TPA: hypothetical protein VJM12_14330 [Pyrinomonadaceae bacterium]|nr:hypothetical protein [Pyrinomonadaceae bacterium]
MAEKGSVKLKIKSPSLDLDFEGNEDFLRTEVLKLVKATTDLQVVKISESLRTLHSELQESLISRADVEKEIEELKSQLESGPDPSEISQLRLQMMMERMAKAFQMMSNIMKKSSETAAAIIQNIKA